MRVLSVSWVNKPEAQAKDQDRLSVAGDERVDVRVVQVMLLEKAFNGSRDFTANDKPLGMIGDLIAAVAREILQQARAHLPDRQRQRRDGDREHRAGNADRRRCHRAEQRPCAGGSAVIEPVLQQPIGDMDAAIQIEQDKRAEYACNYHQCRHQRHRQQRRR